MEVINGDGREDTARKAFEEFMNELRSLPPRKPILVSLCGGDSVSEFYREIGKNFHKLPFQRMHFFMLDERLDRKNRNSDVVKRELISFIPEDIRPEVQHNFHFLEEVESQAAGKQDLVEKYNELFRSYSLNRGFDIIIASSGDDLHFASLFPKHDLLGSKQKGYAFLDNSPKPPSERMTLLPESVLKSRVSFLFFMGEKKRDAYLRFSREDLTVTRSPVKLLDSTKLCVVTDL